MASGDRFLDRLAGFLAALWYRLDARHRRITLANLEFAYGAALTPAGPGAPGPGGLPPVSCASPGRSWNCSWPPCPYIRRKVIILGEEHLEAALAQGRGAIAIAAHAGNWEYTVMGYGLHMPARRWWWAGTWTSPGRPGWPGISGSGAATPWSPSRRA